MFEHLKQFLLSVFQLTHALIQLLRGIWRVWRLPKPVVSIFGGARFKQEDYYTQQAYILAKRLTENNISILTGGGPGIMQAATCGGMARTKGKGRVMGINVVDLNEPKSPCQEEYLEVKYFFTRKWLLTQYSQVFIVFPGGFGTIDEFSEVITLIQTKKLPPEPIILVGVEYWQPFYNWLKKEALSHGAVKESDLDLFMLSDDFEEIYCVVIDKCSFPPWGKPDQKDTP